MYDDKNITYDKSIDILKARTYEIKNNIRDLKLQKKYLEYLMIVLSFLWGYLIFGLTNGFAQSNPVEINDLMFFVESKSITVSNHISFCESSFCLNHPNTENAIISEQYCDVAGSCEEGCVRRWLDLSDYMPAGGFNPPEYTNGRNFGQDDSEKPCYIDNCLNGNPCVRGGGPYNGFSQDKYLELQIPDFINLSNDFSIFLLAKPIDQSDTGDWFYFGQSSHFLKHDVAQNRLKLRVPGNLQTPITQDNSIALGEWQLIEIYRSNTGQINVFVNGQDKTLNNSIALNGNFQIGYLFSNFKTTGQQDQTAMYGDIASFLVYNRNLIHSEIEAIRTYFQVNYLGEPLSNSGIKELDLELKVKGKIINILNPKSIKVYSIELFDVLGKKVTDVNLKSSEKVIRTQLPDLERGIYIVRVNASDRKNLKAKILL